LLREVAIEAPWRDLVSNQTLHPSAKTHHSLLPKLQPLTPGIHLFPAHQISAPRVFKDQIVEKLPRKVTNREKNKQQIEAANIGPSSPSIPSTSQANTGSNAPPLESYHSAAGAPTEPSSRKRTALRKPGKKESLRLETSRSYQSMVNEAGKNSLRFLQFAANIAAAANHDAAVKQGESWDMVEALQSREETLSKLHIIIMQLIMRI
jgi:hypothetical protein